MSTLFGILPIFFYGLTKIDKWHNLAELPPTPLENKKKL